MYYRKITHSHNLTTKIFFCYSSSVWYGKLFLFAHDRTDQLCGYCSHQAARYFYSFCPSFSSSFVPLITVFILNTLLTLLLTLSTRSAALHAGTCSHQRLRSETLASFFQRQAYYALTFSSRGWYKAKVGISSRPSGIRCSRIYRNFSILLVMGFFSKKKPTKADFRFWKHKGPPFGFEKIFFLKSPQIIFLSKPLEL